MNEDEKLHRSNNRKKVTEYLGRAHGYNLTHFHTEIMMTDEYNSSYKMDISKCKLPDVKLDYEKTIKFSRYDYED